MEGGKKVMFLDENAEVAIALPVSFDAFGNIITTKDSAKIWSDRVQLAIGTNIGERVMRPDYGTKIAQNIFNTHSAMEENIRAGIQTVFSRYLPLLTLSDIVISINETDNIVTADITYELPNQVEETTSVGIVVVSQTRPPYEEKL
jgi:phage baseplate assembly protein W